MVKSLLTILFSLIITSGFSQNFDYLQAYRRFTLAGRSVKGISNDTSWLIGSADSLVTQYALKGYLDNRFGPQGNHLFGEEHQLLGAKYDNSDVLEFLEPLVEGNFIVSDSELTAAKLIYISQSDIFTSWKRFSHGDNSPQGQGFINSSDTIPGIPLETNSWSYNAGTDQISSTLNSSSHIGFVSPLKYSNYNQSLTITGSSADNDYISVIIAYVEDYNDMVKNNAYGLNPADFNWPINTTDRTIPNQHTLSLVRSRTSQGNFPFTVPVRYGIVYDLGKRSQQILINGESLTWNTNDFFGTGQSADVKVIRKGDSVFTYTTDWTDAPGGKGTLGKELRFDLSSLAITQKFRGPAAYGYGALSQANATYSDIKNNILTNVIYDLRNGDKWIADNGGNYSLDTGSYFKDYGVRRFLYNPTTNKTFYMKYDHTFDLIGSGNIFNLTSDTTNTNNYYTTENNYYTTDSSFLDSRDFSNEGTAISPYRTKPLIITSVGTIPSYNHETKELNIPLAGGGTGGSGWGLTGNDINPATNFLGTTSNNSLRFRTNNVQKMIIDSIGNVAIGSNTAASTSYKLDVAGSGRFTQNLDVGTMEINGLSSTRPAIIGMWRAPFNGSNLTFLNDNQGGSRASFDFQSTFGASSLRSFFQDAAIVRIGHGFSEPNANNPYNASALEISPTYDLSGSGTLTAPIVRGIWYNPTVTNLRSVKHIAIQTNLGDIIFKNLPTYGSNAEALGAGKEAGTVYRNGDDLKIVH